MDYPSYWGILIAPVRYDKRLTPHAKILYTEISALTQKDGICFASNNYFAELYDVSKSTVSRWVSELYNAGHITIAFSYIEGSKEIEKRIIMLTAPICHSEVYSKSAIGYSQKEGGGIPKKRKDNNTSNNNINIILEKFSELFENKLKEKYIISYGRDNKIIKDLLLQSDIESIIKKMELFFTSDLWFTKDGIYTIQKFKQRWNEIIKKQETNQPLKQPVNKYETSEEIAERDAEHIKRIRGGK